MATLKELEEALVNADAAGDASSATALANEIVRVREAEKKAAFPQQAMPPMRNKPGVSGTESVLRGVYDPFTGMAQGLYNVLPQGVQTAGNKLNDYLASKTGMFPVIGDAGLNAKIASDEAAYQQRRGSGLDVGRIAGNVVSPINAAIAMKAPQAASLVGRVVQGAGVGATQAMTQPVTQGDYLTEKLKQGNVGLAVGGALPVVTSGVARVVSPKASLNPDVALLKSKGVNPTIGQTLGGAYNTTEQKATSLFGVGDSIRSARESARDQFNKAVINDVVESVGGKVDDIGREGVRKAGDIVSKSYDDIWASFKGLNFDKQFAQDFGQLQQLSTGLTPDMQRKFNSTVNNYLASRVSPNGGMTSETLKKAYSDIGDVQRQYAKSSGAEGELGSALKQLQALIMNQVGRASPVAAKQMQASDLAWAKLVRVEDSAKRSTTNDGVFTPGQFLGALKGNSASVRGRDFSRGTALGQSLGEAGQKVLGNTYPDSGTAGRVLNVLQGAGAVTNPALTLGGMAVGMGAYTPAMQKALVAAASNRGASAPFIAEELRKLTPILNPLGYGLLNSRN